MSPSDRWIGACMPGPPRRVSPPGPQPATSGAGRGAQRSRLDAGGRPQAGRQAGNGSVRPDSLADTGTAHCSPGSGRTGGQARPQRGTTGQTTRAHPRERDTWSTAEVRKFLAKASSDRLYAAWRQSLYGLRRGEVLGLRWSDIDLRVKTLTVNQARVLVEYRVRIEEPKSRNGKRTLPLDAELVAALAGRCCCCRCR